MTKLPDLYPLKFVPILKEKVWGGDKLHTVLKKKGTKKTGESWEISGVEEAISQVANGSLKDQSLTDLIKKYKEELVGVDVYKNFGHTFPLLFKFIDADQDLSVQVHPDDKLAKEKHNSFGKTEMWYIVASEKGARLILGFQEGTSEQEYLESLSKGTLSEILNFEYIQAGDVFYLTPGTVHAIGAGILLAEIQQTSDITYRIYDWDRPDLNGKMRELHTDLAKQAIDYNATNAEVAYENLKNEVIPLKSTRFFETNKLFITQTFERDLKTIDSFIVYMCVDGKATIKANGFSEKIQKGETLLIPASFTSLTIISSSVSLLETYIP